MQNPTHKKPNKGINIEILKKRQKRKKLKKTAKNPKKTAKNMFFLNNFFEARQKTKEKIVAKDSYEVNMLRTFPQWWGNVFADKSVYANTIKDFFLFAKNLYRDLKGAVKYDGGQLGAEFAEYVDLFDAYYSKFLSLMYDQSKVEDYQKRFSIDEWLFEKRFSRDGLYDFTRFENIISQEKNGRILVSIKDEVYSKISDVAKKLFVLEKIAGSQTKKLWQEQLTPIEKLDMSKPYKILAKIVFPFSWREDNEVVTQAKINFMQKKQYQSASLISNEKNQNFMYYYGNTVSALLMYESDAKKVVSACVKDAYSEEYIDGKTPFLDQINYTDVGKIDELDSGSGHHTLFAQSTCVATPNFILNDQNKYNEVLLKQPKIVGVLAPNLQSVEFAKKVAKQNKVLFFGTFEDRQKTNDMI